MNVRVSLVLLFAFALVLAADAANAHNSSVTKVRANLSADSVQATFAFNQGDLLYFVLNESDRHAFLDASELESSRDRVTQYVTRNVELRIDGKLIAPTTTTAPSPGTTQASRFSDAATVPLTLRWRFPAPATKASLTFNLFDSRGFDAIFEVTSVVLQDARTSRVEYLHVGDTVSFDLPAVNSTAQLLPRAPPLPAQPSGPPTWLETAGQFLRLGFTHIIPEGLDHILFVIGLFFLSPKIKPLLTQVTAFTVAHSITLALSVLGYVSLPGRIVEPLIAISITAVALENIFTRRVHPWRWAIVFGFGLIHGLGFAGILHETSLPPGGLAAALVSFNVGVELGQLTVIAVVFAATVWFHQRSWYFRYISAPASFLIACVGLFWAIQRVFFES